MLFPDFPNTGLKSSILYLVFFFISHIFLYACNIIHIEALVAPLSFISHLFNISTFKKDSQFFVSLSKKKKHTQIFCILSSITVILVVAFRVLYQFINHNLPEFNLKKLQSHQIVEILYLLKIKKLLIFAFFFVYS